MPITSTPSPRTARRPILAMAAASLTMLVATTPAGATAVARGGEPHSLSGAPSKGSVTVVKPWARTSPMEASMGAVYMRLRNRAGVANALVGASVPASVAREVQLHQTTMGPGGTMQMSEVPEIMLPAQSTTKLEPGGYHIMLMDLATPLKTGTRIRVTLKFKDGSTKTVQAVVRR